MNECLLFKSTMELELGMERDRLKKSKVIIDFGLNFLSSRDYYCRLMLRIFTYLRVEIEWLRHRIDTCWDRKSEACCLTSKVKSIWRRMDFEFVIEITWLESNLVSPISSFESSVRISTVYVFHSTDMIWIEFDWCYLESKSISIILIVLSRWASRFWLVKSKIDSRCFKTNSTGTSKA